MTTFEPKPAHSWSNVSVPSWQSADSDDSLWTTSAIGAFVDYLPHFQLQDEVAHARRANSKQSVWKGLLLGYALVIAAARITTLTLSRRLVMLTALLLAITIAAASPHLQSLSSQTLLMAISVAILEVACVARLLSVKPFGPVAAVTGALLRLITALGPLVFKNSAFVNLIWLLLPNVGLLAPAAFLLILVYIMDKSQLSEGKNCSSATVQHTACPSATPLISKPSVEAALKQTLKAPVRELHKKRGSTAKRKLLYEEVNLRRSTRIRRHVQRFDLSAQTKPA